MLWLCRWEFTRTGDLFNGTIYFQVGLQKSQYVWRVNLISHLQRRVQESPFLQKGGKWVVLTWLLRLWGVPHCVCVSWVTEVWQKKSDLPLPSLERSQQINPRLFWEIPSILWWNASTLMGMISSSLRAAREGSPNGRTDSLCSARACRQLRWSSWKIGWS